jgi:putative phosphoribosyl transferase
MMPGRKVPMGGGQTEISIEAGTVTLDGTLAVPDKTTAIVLFAHGSGSSRQSPRNRYVAQVLQSQGIGTLLFDLLTREEEAIDEMSGELRFNIRFLATRLIDVTRSLIELPDLQGFRVGYFGASTGAAAALVAASKLPDAIGAVVSRGGRPDLAGNSLGSVQAPTLLIVGGEDKPVLGMNQEALAKLRCEKKLVTVPGATHLFEEPGTLEEVSRLATEWFKQHLTAAAKPSGRVSARR